METQKFIALLLVITMLTNIISANIYANNITFNEVESDNTEDVFMQDNISTSSALDVSDNIIDTSKKEILEDTNVAIEKAEILVDDNLNEKSSIDTKATSNSDDDYTLQDTVSYKIEDSVIDTENINNQMKNTNSVISDGEDNVVSNSAIIVKETTTTSSSINIEVPEGTTDKVISSDITLSEDMYFLDVTLKSGTINLNGHTLTIKGNLNQYGGSVHINNGKLIIEEDYIIENPNGETYAYLDMTSSNDYVLVYGDFVTKSLNDHTNFLTDGILEVKGNFEQYLSQNNFFASDNHKVLLSGDSVQKVQTFENGHICFNTLELNNIATDGVCISGCITVNDRIIQNNTIISQFDLKNTYTTIGNDLKLNCDLHLENASITLNSECLIVYGDLYGNNNLYLNSSNSTNSSFIINGDVIVNSGTFNVNSCNFNVKGDIKIAENSTFYSYSALITLCGNEEQKIDVGATINKLTVDNSSDEGVSIYGLTSLQELNILNNSKIKEITLNNASLNLREDLQITGDLNINNSYVYLNEYTLSILGNLNQNKASVYLNNGNLKINGNYFFDNGYITDLGNIEIKGNFKQIGTSSYNLGYNTKFIFNGDNKQTIEFENPNTYFAGTLELRNTSEDGIEFLSPISFPGKLVIDCKVNNLDFSYNTYYINEEKEINYNFSISNSAYLIVNQKFRINNDFTINGGSLILNNADMIINGDLYLNGGAVNLCEHTLTVTGNIYQQGGSLNTQGGKLYVNGNYIIDNTEENTPAYLNMTYENAYVCVDGDFIMKSSNSHYEKLTNGVLEIKGDFEQAYNGSRYNFYATDNHKVILSGNNIQNITFANPTTSVFSILELNNQSNEGVHFITDVQIKNNFIQNNCNITREGTPTIDIVLDSDTTINGDYEISDGTIDLNGYTLTIMGNLNQLDGILDINGGQLIVNGNYNISNQGKECYAVLKMTNQNDYVCVDGDFTTKSDMKHTGYLTNGVLEIKGDFEQGVNDESNISSSYYKINNFDATENHKVILSGDVAQTVKFCTKYILNNSEYSFVPSNVGFNNLEIRNTSEEGIEFLSDMRLCKLQNSSNCNISGLNFSCGTYTLVENDDIENYIYYTSKSAKLILADKAYNIVGYTMNGGTIDFNGATLNVDGDLIQNSGIINVNNGSLNILGNYSINNNKSENTYLNMINENDYVFVNGDFYTKAYNSKQYFTNGILEIKGDFQQVGSGSSSYGSSFYSCENHKVILSGDNEQNVNFYSPEYSHIGTLELNNTSSEGINFTSNMCMVDKFISNDSKYVNYNYTFDNKTLTEDTIFDSNIAFTKNSVLDLDGNTLTIDGDFEMSMGTINLNGGTLIINGNFTQNGGTININGGKLYVNGNYTVAGNYSYPAYLKMVNEDDYVCVSGDFIFSAYSNHSSNLTNGILDVKGNFTQSNGYKNFVSTKNHKVILSGNQKQVVSFYNTDCKFNILELRNTSEEGVEFATSLNFINTFIPNDSIYNTITYGSESLLLTEDTTLNYNFNLNGSTIKLNGYILTINSDLEMKNSNIYLNGGTLNIVGDFLFSGGNISLKDGVLTVSENLEQSNGVLNVNGGQLIVNGDYNLTSKSTGSLNMTNENDYVLICGDFLANSYYTEKDYLTNGVLEIRGNFEQKKTYAADNFYASEKHKVILSGDDIQNIVFQNDDKSQFNILEIIKPLEEGYVFSSTPVWNYIKTNSSSDTGIINAPTNLKVTYNSDFSITLNWDTPNCDAEVLGYNIYKDGEKIKTVYTNSYAEIFSKEDENYVYKITAFDLSGNESAFSDEITVVIETDKTAPKILSITPNKGNIVKGNSKFSMLITDDKMLSNVKVCYSIFGSNTEKQIYSKSFSTKSELVTFNWNTENFEEGNYNIIVYVYDSSNNYRKYTYYYNLANVIPESVIPTAESGAFCAKLSWEDVNDNTAYYKIYRSTDNGANYRYVKSTEETSYVDEKLSSDTTYTYKITVVDIYGNYAESDTVNVKPDYADYVKPVANAGLSTTGVVNEEVSFTGSNSTDNVGIVSYLWDFGDGTTSTDADPTHTYTQVKNESNTDYDYNVTLTVTDEAGNSNTAKTIVTVYPAEQIGVLELKVKDTNGNPISDAYVYVDFPDSTEKYYYTNSLGIAKISAMAGNYNISAYKKDYLPNEENIAIEQYKTVQGEIVLEKGEIATADTYVKPMTYDEIVEAGIDVTAPENQYVYEIVTTLVFEQQEIKMPKTIVSGGGTVYSGGGIYYYGGGSSGGYGGGGIIIPKVIANKEHPEVAPTLAYLVIPTTVSWLKEFFNVHMVIDNQALPQFVLQDSKVKLNLPDGISLAPTAIPQTLEVNLGDIKGQESGNVEWIIRGDVAGEYNLSADFSAVLMPFEADVKTTFNSEGAVTVNGENALKMYVYAENTAYIGEKYHAMFNLKNQGSTSLYNLSLKFGSGSGTNYKIDSLDDIERVPMLHDGDIISIDELPAGGVIGGTYETTFIAEGDPEKNYYSLIDKLVTNPDGTPAAIDTEVIPIKSEYTEGVVGGASDSYKVGEFNGQNLFDFMLYYNSMITKESIFNKWYTQFDYTFTKDEFGNYVLSYPDGRKLFFKANYTPISGELTDEEVNVNVNTMLLDGYTPISRGAKQYTITPNGDGFIVENGEKTKYTFDSTGKLSAIEDKTGYRINISENETTKTITEASTGKSIVMNKNADGLVESVESDGGKYSLVYDENKQLISITDPMNAVTEFGYVEDKLSERVEKNAENVAKTVFKNTYDSEGRIASRTDGKGNSITYSYDTSEFWRIKVDETDRMGYNSSKVFNRFGELVSFTDSLGNTTTMTYDGNGNLASVTEPEPLKNTIIYKYDDKNNLLEIIDTEENVTSFEYDNNSNQTKITKADGSTITKGYNDKNLLTSQTDERGNTTSYNYDSKGNVTSISVAGKTAKYTYENEKLKTATDFNGNVTTYDYDSKGRVTSVKDALGNITGYEYDADGRNTKITYADGKTELFSYDEKDNLTSHTDRKNTVTSYKYDENYNLVSETISGNTTAYTYDKNDWLISVTDCNNNKKSIVYDKVGRITSETDFEGNATEYTYDNSGRLTSSTTDGATTRYAYTKIGRLYTVTDALNNVTTYNYDKVGNVVEAINAKGGSTLYEYDNSGNLEKITTPLGITNEFTYDFRNNVLTAKDGKGNITANSYDNNGNLVKTTYANGSAVSYGYDALNRQTSITDPNGNVTKAVYDSVGNTTEILKPLNVKQSMTYDENGNIVEIKDSNDIVIQKAVYDFNNKPLEITDALGNTVKATYDGLGNQLTYTTARGNQYNYDYDGNGRVVKVTDPLEGVAESVFDKRGNQTGLTDQNDNTTTYSYDLLNRLVSEKTSDGNSDIYAYDNLGALTSYTNKRGQATTYTYDADGRRTSRVTPEGTTTYTYDNNNNVLTVTDSNGKISRTYDSLNRVTSYTDAKGNTIGYEYDSNGNLSKLVYPDRKTVSYGYNANNQMVTVTDWNNRTTTYDYDNNGRLIKESRPNGTYQTYTYNNAGQLISTTDQKADGSIINKYDYEYDADGNIITEDSINEPNYDNITIPSSEMNYGSANRLVDFNGTAISYDKDGNMLNTPLGNKWGILTYDSRNMLIDVVTSDGTIEYEYDAENNRTLKTEYGKTTSYVVNSNVSLSQVLTSTKDGETTYYIYGLGLISEEKADTYKIYHYDYRGSTTVITDSSGNVTDRFYYDPYGSIINRTGATDTPFLYVGKYGVETDDNGLYYMRARYYIPSIQRFVNVDPIRDGLNWYGYCEGNSINAIDPTGKITQQEIDNFENGKMAPMAYTYLMKLTYDWWLADTQAEKDAIKTKADAFRNTGYTKTGNNQIDSNIAYMLSLPISDITEEQHYFRNKLNIEYNWETFQKLQNRLPNQLKWIEIPLSEAAFHQNKTVNDKPNRKYLSSCGYFEMVFNGDNVLQNEQNNTLDMGTYNYCSHIIDNDRHKELDVDTYFKYANVKADSNGEIINTINFGASAASPFIEGKVKNCVDNAKTSIDDTIYKINNYFEEKKQYLINETIRNVRLFYD